VADLSKPEERPGLAVDGILRALRVTAAASGLDFEGAARLVLLGADLSDAVAGVPIPEAGWTDALFGGIPATFAAFEVTAGQRGCWALPYPAGGVDGAVLRFDSQDAATAAGAGVIAVLATPAPNYSINGGVTSIVRHVTQGIGSGVKALRNAVASPAASIGGPVAWFGRSGFWIPPGGILRVFQDTVGTASQVGAIIREPLAGP
jgi:hypothetical protein